jgi:predicted SPOUT superfamily RNA methylase MTH1
MSSGGVLMALQLTKEEYVRLQETSKRNNRGTIKTQSKDPRIRNRVLFSYMLNHSISKTNRGCGYSVHVVRDILKKEGVIR